MMHAKRWTLIAGLAAVLVAGGGVLLRHGWAAESGRVDHSGLDALLQAHVVEGFVDYAGLKPKTAALDAYLQGLAEADLARASRAEKLAFYINAYNAATIRMILRHYGEIESIRAIEDRYGYHQWTHEEWPLAGEVLSLDQIEHRKLRGDLREPRIHFAIVCASVSCPPLHDRAYTAEGVDAQLEAAAKRFNGSRTYVRTEPPGDDGAAPVLRISRIYSWFKGDFKPGVVAYLRQYTDGATREFIDAHSGALEVAYLPYDWSLNDASKRQAKR